MSRKLLILGAGGTGREVLDIIDALNVAGAGDYVCGGFLDDDPGLWGREIRGLRVHGALAQAAEFDGGLVDALGSPGSYAAREGVLAAVSIAPERFETLVHPTAVCSPSSSLGMGSIVYPHVVIGAEAKVGHHVTIMAGAAINHDAAIGDFSIVTGGVNVAGRVRVGRSCYIGSAACLRQDVTVGDGSLIGMGSVVLDDVPAKSVVAGNPARFLRSAVVVSGS